MESMSFLYKLRVEGALDEGLISPLEPVQTNDETTALIEAFGEVTKKFPPKELDKLGVVPEEGLDMMRKAGFFGMTIPKKYGGAGLTFRSYLALVEQVAAKDIALALVSLAHLSIGLEGIILFGTEEQKERYLRPAASGEMIFAYALTEPDTGSDAQHITTSVALAEDGSHYILNGRKTYITNGNYAGGYTVFAKVDGGKEGEMVALIVERGWEGVEVGADLEKMGIKASSTTPIKFDGVKVPVENILGKPGDGFKIAMTILNYGRLAVASAGVGLMKRSVEDMRARASKRIQFGVPIIDFELIKEKIAKARVHAFAAETMVWATAEQLDRDPTANAAMETSHCKLYSTTKTWETLYDAQQVAGGSGYLATAPYERRLRDWRVATIFEGTTEIHSIYPALFAARAVSREIPKGKWEAVKYLIFHAFRYPREGRWPRQPALKRALLTAKTLGRRFRFGFNFALMRYGKKLPMKEIYLRKLAWLSLGEFAIRTALIRVGENPTREEVDLISYLREDAVSATSCLSADKREKLLSRLGR